MAKKNLISDYTAKRFADIINDVLNRAEEGKWQKPWFTPAFSGAPARNIDRPDPYQGFNASLLSMVTAINNYRTPLFLTADRARELGLKIRTIEINGKKMKEESYPVLKWLLRITDKEGNKITEDEYDQLTKEEKDECRTRWHLRGYFVYNIDQTTMKEELPKAYEKFCSLYKEPTDTLAPTEDAKDEALDYILSTQGAWRCPINHDGGNQAYYSPMADRISLPQKKYFKTTLGYYGTALHEMAHSTKGEANMKRDYGRKKWGDEGYALEELVAEFTSAFVCCDRGHTKQIDSSHVQYIQSWRKAISNKDIVSTIVDDLMRCVNYEIKYLREVDELLYNKKNAA